MNKARTITKENINSEESQRYLQLQWNDCYGKHTIRDNILGITWCIRCGRLFTKPCGVNIKEDDILIVTDLH